MEKTLKYIKYSLYFYGSFILLLYFIPILIDFESKTEIGGGLIEGVAILGLTYYLFSSRHMIGYWITFLGTIILGLISLIPLLILMIPPAGLSAEEIEVAYVLVFILIFSTVPLMIASYHLAKKDVRTYLTSGSK